MVGCQDSKLEYQKDTNAEKIHIQIRKTAEKFTFEYVTGLTKLGGKRWKLVEKRVKNGNIINPSDVYHQFMFILST